MKGKSMKIKATITCTMMPNQIEGKIGSIPFYYWARLGSFSLSIWPDTENRQLVDFGDTKTAGWWEKKTMMKRLKRSVNRAKKRGLLHKSIVI